MSAKPFDETIKKSCIWCVYGKKSEYTNDVFCKKKGVTSSDDYCRKYKYDPLKRTPERQSIEKDYKADDFII